MATITKDTSNQAGYNGAGVPSATISLTTTGTNRLAVLIIYSGTAANVSSVSGGGTWTFRLRNAAQTFEVWTCPLAAQQTGVTVTITFGTNQSAYALILDTFYDTGAAAIPTYDAGAIGASGTGVTTGVNGTDVLSYVLGSGPPTVAFTAGTGYTKTTTATTSGGSVGICGELANSDTPNSGTTVNPGFTINSGTISTQATFSITYATFLLDQRHYRIIDDDGAINAGTFLANEDTTYGGLEASTNIRLRFSIENRGTVAGSVTPRLEFKEDSGAWTRITTNSNNVRLTLSGNFADGDATTRRLTAYGTFQASQGKESGSDAAAVSLTNGNSLEVEYCIAFQQAAAGKSYQFRISNAGTVLQTYTITPTLNVIKWSSVGAIYYFDSTKFDGTLTCFGEGYGYTNNANLGVYFRVYNITDSSVVANSKTAAITNTSTVTRVRSSAITLTTGKEYRVEIGQAKGSSAIHEGGAIVIQQAA